MAYKLLEEASWGLKLRLFVGAMICVSDVATDIYMIFYFFSKTGAHNATFGWLTSALITISIICQLTIVHWNGRENQFKEKIIVISCLKPIFDAHRMVQQDDGDSVMILSSVQEAIFCKCIEMMFESIPGGIIQSIAFLDNGAMDVAPLLSIFLSCLSTGYIMTSVTYDLDIDPNSRRDYAHHGWVPNDATGR